MLSRYVPATFTNRYSPTAWLRWARGRPYPDGENFNPEGYNINELGPQKLEKLGQKECAETRERLMGAGRDGYPFGFGKS